MKARDPMEDLTEVPDSGLGWLDASGDHAEIVLSTRVRLARNLQGHAFGPRARVNDREAVLDQIRTAKSQVDLLRGCTVVNLPSLDTRSRRILLERRLISRELMGDGSGPARGTAVLLSGRQPLSVMVNEEDHLRLQSLVAGLRLQEAWSLVDRLDEDLGQRIPYAFHHEFGFLTSCPTNVGTGVRASVLMHLPGLVLTKEIGKVLQGLTQVGLTFRGLYGEGSEVVGNFFQVSNQTTLGKSEEDLVDHLDRIVRQVIQYETQARKVLLKGRARRDRRQDLAGVRFASLRADPIVRGIDEPVFGGPTGGQSETPPGTSCIHAQQADDLHAAGSSRAGRGSGPSSSRERCAPRGLRATRARNRG